MKTKTISVALIIVLFSSSIANQDSQQIQSVSRSKLNQIDINLDIDPSQRLKDLHSIYAPVLKDVEKKMIIQMKKMYNLSENVFKLLSTVLRFAYYFKTNSEIFDEIISISRASGVEISHLMLFNFFYEISSEKLCTSIITRNSDGEILFGSNLDFFFPAELSQLAYFGNFKKNGKTLYIGQGLYGVIGLLRGSRPGEYTLSINQRNSHQTTIFREIFSFGSREILYFVREVLETKESFSSALEYIKTAKLRSTAYYIIGGVSGNEGRLVIRNPDSVHAEYALNSTKWFIVQTNSDRDDPNAKMDRRREAAERKLTQRGPDGLDLVDLDKILSETPNHMLQPNLATITTVLSRNDENNQFFAYVWNFRESLVEDDKSKDSFGELLEE